MGYRYEIKSKCGTELDKLEKLILKTVEDKEGQGLLLETIASLSNLINVLNNRLNTNVELYANCVSQYDKTVGVYEEEIDHLKERIRVLESRINVQCHQLNLAQKDKTDADNEAYALRLENERLKKQLQDRSNRLIYLEELNKMLLEDYNGETINIRENGTDKSVDRHE